MLKKAPNGEIEYIQCKFMRVFDNGVEQVVNDEASSLEERMSYSPKAILEIVDSGNEIDRFPLRYVVNSMKKGRNINWDYTESTKIKIAK